MTAMEQKVSTMITILQERGYNADDIDSLVEWWQAGKREKARETDPEWRISKILQDIGISIKLQGFYYLQTAIELRYKNPDKLKKSTVELYPAVAEKHGTNAKLAERSMRYAIHSSWELKVQTKYWKYATYTTLNANNKPTISQFVDEIASYLRQQDMLQGQEE